MRILLAMLVLACSGCSIEDRVNIRITVTDSHQDKVLLDSTGRFPMNSEYTDFYMNPVEYVSIVGVDPGAEHSNIEQSNTFYERFIVRIKSARTALPAEEGGTQFSNSCGKEECGSWAVNDSSQSPPKARWPDGFVEEGDEEVFKIKYQYAFINEFVEYSSGDVSVKRPALASNHSSFNASLQIGKSYGFEVNDSLNMVVKLSKSKELSW